METATWGLGFKESPTTGLKVADGRIRMVFGTYDANVWVLGPLAFVTPDMSLSPTLTPKHCSFDRAGGEETKDNWASRDVAVELTWIRGFRAKIV